MQPPGRGWGFVRPFGPAIFPKNVIAAGDSERGGLSGCSHQEGDGGWGWGLCGPSGRPFSPRTLSPLAIVRGGLSGCSHQEGDGGWGWGLCGPSGRPFFPRTLSPLAIVREVGSPDAATRKGCRQRGAEIFRMAASTIYRIGVGDGGWGWGLCGPSGRQFFPRTLSPLAIVLPSPSMAFCCCGPPLPRC